MEPSGAGGGSARLARSLFGHRTAPNARAGAHGARRRSHRFHRALASLAINGGRDCAAHFRDPHACRQAIQHRIAATIGQGLVRGFETSCAREIWQRQDHFHGGRCAGRAGRRSRNRAQGAGISPAYKIERHLRRRAAGADRSANRAAAHQLQSNRRGDGAAILLESEPAEHPDTHRIGTRDPRRVRAARGVEAGSGGLLADRAAAARAHVAKIRCCWRHSAPARTFTRARRAKCWESIR